MIRQALNYSLILLVAASLGLACKGETKKEDAPPVPARELSIKGEEVSYATDTTEMKGYLAYNGNLETKRPGILVIHEWWGHNDYTRQRADMLAELGYTALAVDMYGNGRQADHPEDAGKFAGMVMQNMDAAQARFDAALELLKSHSTVNPDQIAAIGYCFGGSVALTMANAGKDLDAVAAFHSGVQLPVMPNENLKARVLVCNGAEDPFISPESVTAFTRAMDSIKADYKYITYEGATHSFTSKAADSLGKKFDMPLAYQEKADKESWQQLQDFLNETFN